MIKHFATITAVSLSALSLVQAASFDFVGWNFNTDDNGGSTGTLAPFFGSGQLNPIGNTVLQFGFTGGSSEGGVDNSALWLVAPAGSSAGDLIGVDFTVPSQGLADIQARFDLFLPTEPTPTFAFEYSHDNGGTWFQYGTFQAGGTSTWGTWTQGLWSNANLVNLDGDLAVGSDPNLRLRILTTLPADVTSDTVLAEVDAVVVGVNVSAVPEPTAMAMALGLAGLVAARRLARK